MRSGDSVNKRWRPLEPEGEDKRIVRKSSERAGPSSARPANVAGNERGGITSKRLNDLLDTIIDQEFEQSLEFEQAIFLKIPLCT